MQKSNWQQVVFYLPGMEKKFFEKVRQGRVNGFECKDLARYLGNHQRQKANVRYADRKIPSLRKSTNKRV